MSILPKLIHRFPIIPNKFPAAFIAKLIVDSEINMEMQRNYIVKAILKKSNKYGDSHYLVSKLTLKLVSKIIIDHIDLGNTKESRKKPTHV